MVWYVWECLCRNALTLGTGVVEKKPEGIAIGRGCIPESIYAISIIYGGLQWQSLYTLCYIPDVHNAKCIMTN